MKTLVVEDDPILSEQITEQLRKQGFAVSSAQNGEDGLYFALEYPIDVAIIDLGLPKLSGLEVIRRTRAAGKTFPILILTARNRWQEKVEGLEAGADDYVAKPFQVEEVLARLRALLRRSGGWAQPVLTCAPITLDSTSQKVSIHDRLIDLTAFEFKVLEYLMLHAGEVISKTKLMEHIYEEDSERDSNTIEVFIGRLRKKLDPHDRLKPIETLKGRGYRFNLKRATTAT